MFIESASVKKIFPETINKCFQKVKLIQISSYLKLNNKKKHSSNNKATDFSNRAKHFIYSDCKLASIKIDANKKH